MCYDTAHWLISSISVQTFPFSFILCNVFLNNKYKHTQNAQVNKIFSISNPEKEGFFCILQSNSWLGLGGLRAEVQL